MSTSTTLERTIAPASAPRAEPPHPLVQGLVDAKWPHPRELAAQLQRGAGRVRDPSPTPTSPPHRLDSFWGELHHLIATHGCTRRNGKPTSFQTRHNLRQGLCRLMEVLRKPYPIVRPQNFDGRHLAYLYGWLQDRYENHLAGRLPSLSPCTVSDYTSYLRSFCRWIGQPELVHKTGLRFTLPGATQRATAADSDPSWEAAGLDIGAVIDKAFCLDPYVGMALLAQHAFGLRRKEAICFNPSRDYQGTHLSITVGTKGGRSRIVFLEHRWQHEVIAVIQQWLIDGKRPYSALGGSVNLAGRLRRYSYVLGKLGITKDGHGVTGHGLRAGFACRTLESYGVLPPVRGGDGSEPPGEQHAAYLAASEAMGHGRRSAMQPYVGALGPSAVARRRVLGKDIVAHIAEIDMPEILLRIQRAVERRAQTVALLEGGLRPAQSRAAAPTATPPRVPEPPGHSTTAAATTQPLGVTS